MLGSSAATSSLSLTLSHSTGPTLRFASSSSHAIPALTCLLGRYLADHLYCKTKIAFHEVK